MTSTRSCSTVVAGARVDDAEVADRVDGVGNVAVTPVESFAESAHAKADAAMSKAARPRRIELFTLPAIVIG